MLWFVEAQKSTHILMSYPQVPWEGVIPRTWPDALQQDQSHPMLAGLLSSSARCLSFSRAVEGLFLLIYRLAQPQPTKETLQHEGCALQLALQQKEVEPHKSHVYLVGVSSSVGTHT